jgi:hypothetical protein
VAFADKRERQVGAIAGDVDQFGPIGDLGDMRNVIWRGAEIDRKGAAIAVDEHAILIVGVPGSHALDLIRTVKIDGKFSGADRGHIDCQRFRHGIKAVFQV